MISEPDGESASTNTPQISAKHTARLKLLGIILTVGGIFLFAYFVYSVGIDAIAANARSFGWDGLAVVVLLYFARMAARAGAWSLSVYAPYKLRLRDTIPAVIIGEALSTMIPLGILVSGTTKAVAVRKRVPLVVGLSSVATENLFYSFVTSAFLIGGALVLVRSFELDREWIATIDVLIAAIAVIFAFLLLLIVRQWHFASELCERLYRRGWARNWLEHGRMQVRLFENLIYAFYRRYPNRFLPIVLCEAAYHALGVAEVLFVLSRIAAGSATVLTSFLLESVSRLLTIVFKLVPFLIGIDEAGAKFVADTVAIGAGIGVTLALIRKGRVLFWTAVGLALIVRRGLSLRDITDIKAKAAAPSA